MKSTALLLGIILLSTTGLIAQNQEPLANELRNLLKSESFNVGLLLQSEANFSFENDNYNNGRSFTLGATRLDIRGKVDGGFNYRLQLELRRAVSLLDAQIGYTFENGVQVVGGAFKPFTSRDLDPNPGATDFINRARQVGAMMNSREIGVTVFGDAGNLRYIIGMYNGNGLNNSNFGDNRFLYTARLGYSHEASTGDVEVGLNTAINTSRFETVGNTGLVSVENRVLYGPYVEYSSDSWFGTAEFQQTRFERADNNLDETITGFYVTVGNKITEKSELLIRWDHLSYDIRPLTSDLLILGWNHQATSLISFQVNILARSQSNSDTQLGATGLMQFQF